MQPIGPARYEGSRGTETFSDFTSSSFHADGNCSFLFRFHRQVITFLWVTSFSMLISRPKEQQTVLCSLLCIRSASSFFFKVAPKFTSLFLGRTHHLSLSSHHQMGLASSFLWFTCNSITKISIIPNKVPKLHEYFRCPAASWALLCSTPPPQTEDQAPEVWSIPTPQAQEIHCREHPSPETFEGRLNSTLSPHVSGNALKFPPVSVISFLIHP